MDTETLDIRSISMLCPDTISKLTEFADMSRGGIVELGAYIGGSTVALARGNKGRHPHAVIECGGAHDHPTLPSSNILADWKRNVEAFGFSDAVRLCKGFGYDYDVTRQAIRHAGPIGLLFMDADGFIAPPLKTFAPYMQPDCLLAIDDYYAPGAEEKAAMVKPFIDAQVESGTLVEMAQTKYTWFGRVNGTRALQSLAALLPVRRETGHCLLSPAMKGHISDTMEIPSGSRLRLYEDGRELGPAHSCHADIRENGGGRYSHWTIGGVRWLYWSTSDNSDPGTNGRRYEVDFGHSRMLLSEI